MAKSPTKKHAGHFQPGNQLWQQRKFTIGIEPYYDGPEDFLKDCCDYFNWCIENPWQEEVLVSYEGVVKKEKKAKLRPYTIGGCCIFIGVTSRTWGNWRKDRSDLLPVIEYAEEVIRNQKFEGAAAGFFNANIISRDLGLADKRTSELSGPDGGPIEVTNTDVPLKDLPQDKQKELLSHWLGDGDN